jgi:type VI secretion system protein ImpF
MAEISNKERLQPSLLDRLTDDEPDKSQESIERRTLTAQQLKESVCRDLDWLLNTANIASGVDLSHWPEVERSTVNYGIDNLAGRPASGVDRLELARRLRKTIQEFEPRLLRDSVVVRVSEEQSKIRPNELAFLIEGHLWFQPLPIRLYLRTIHNLEDGHVRVTEEMAE